jgi:3-dehydroquinate dehydratase-2
MLVLVLQGPNLDRLGVRDPKRFGTQTLAQLEAKIAGHASGLGLDVEQFQSNHEGSLLDWLHERQDRASAIICNPAGLTPYGYSLRDALREAPGPLAILHFANPFSPEALHDDIFAEIATFYIAGLGALGYISALEAVHARISGDADL